ncbi:MAG: 16S rRNA (uracil(1498)-N(3))-methyltransferase [Proteobacteria bacterium]|nr:16S rRNA (uracil(1498)-N(3))-methyltransferase [Pseudomonadota bacterium]
MPQFLVQSGDLDAASGTAVLRGEEARHLLRVFRARPGDAVHVFDGEGRRWLGQLVGAGRGEARVEGLAPLPTNEAPVALALIQALPKGERWEWIVEKGTELGVLHFHPVHTARTVSRVPAARGSEKLQRWRKIALAAAKQCERARVPAIAAPLDLRACLAALGQPDAEERRLALTERCRGTRAAETVGPVLRVVLAAGPEGGWSEEDRTALDAAGFQSWGLGPRILRSETAAVAALAVLQARWGDLERPECP